jgi:fructose-1,6-bisphosphatase/inositol monophosphatase family enzyme
MNTEELQGALKAAAQAAKEVGVDLKAHYGQIEGAVKETEGPEDAVRDLVTELDSKTEKALKERLAEYDEAIGFMGEEGGIAKQASTMWLVDPIDGTSHFTRGIPFCTTMIALVAEGVVVISVIYDFVRGDMYTAIRGQGA